MSLKSYQHTSRGVSFFAQGLERREYGRCSCASFILMAIMLCTHQGTNTTYWTGTTYIHEARTKLSAGDSWLRPGIDTQTLHSINFQSEPDSLPFSPSHSTLAHKHELISSAVLEDGLDGLLSLNPEEQLGMEIAECGGVYPAGASGAIPSYVGYMPI